MKFFVALSILFATFLVVKAESLKLVMYVSHDKTHEITGEIKIKLEGATETKEVVFPKKEMFNFERLEMYTEFSEDVEKVTFSWKADNAGTYIKTGNLIIYGENKISNFRADDYFFEDGETQVLVQF